MEVNKFLSRNETAIKLAFNGPINGVPSVSLQKLTY